MKDKIPTVTLICTMHKQSGLCSPEELCRIIEDIAPDVIFEELSLECFDLSYNAQRLKGLETDAIKLYLKSHHIKHLPVDTYELPNHYHEHLDRLYDMVTGSMMIAECRSLRHLLDHQNMTIAMNGFSYLSNEWNREALKERATLIHEILTIIDSEDLWHIYAMEKEVIQKRETEMLTNIYTSSGQNTYARALFFIGSGHRESIIKKIAEFDAKENTPIRWMIRHNDECVPLTDHIRVISQ